MLRADLVVDVTDSCQLGPLRIEATVFLPPSEELAEQATVVFALPGGGYSRGYYDMHFPGHAGYSQAEHHVDRGFVLVAIDHLGVGDSTPEVAGEVRIDDIAAANDFAVRTITDRLRNGTAVKGYPAIDVGARMDRAIDGRLRDRHHGRPTSHLRCHWGPRLQQHPYRSSDA